MTRRSGGTTMSNREISKESKSNIPGEKVVKLNTHTTPSIRNPLLSSIAQWVSPKRLSRFDDKDGTLEVAASVLKFKTLCRHFSLRKTILIPIMAFGICSINSCSKKTETEPVGVVSPFTIAQVTKESFRSTLHTFHGPLSFVRILDRYYTNEFNVKKDLYDQLGFSLVCHVDIESNSHIPFQAPPIIRYKVKSEDHYTLVPNSNNDYDCSYYLPLTANPEYKNRWSASSNSKFKRLLDITKYSETLVKQLGYSRFEVSFYENVNDEFRTVETYDLSKLLDFSLERKVIVKGNGEETLLLDRSYSPSKLDGLSFELSF